MSVSALLPLSSNADLAAPCFSSRVRAGFPSPADDYQDRKLDLNRYLIRHPAATFYCWTEGESMEGAGIYDGDLLIVDRAETPLHGDIVLAWLDGGLTCKRLDMHRQQLCAAHRSYAPLAIGEGSSFEIEGVVISSVRLHRVRPR